MIVQMNSGTFESNIQLIKYIYIFFFKWCDIRPSVGTHTQNLCSAFNPSKVHTHSSEHTHAHTHREHTPGAVGSQCCGARGAVGGSVPCSRSHLSRGIKGGESAVHSLPPPTYNSCRIWNSNSQPFDHESDSLNIRPRLPHPVLPSSVYFTIYIILWYTAACASHYCVKTHYVMFCRVLFSVEYFTIHMPLKTGCAYMCQWQCHCNAKMLCHLMLKG